MLLFILRKNSAAMNLIGFKVGVDKTFKEHYLSFMWDSRVRSESSTEDVA